MNVLSVSNSIVKSLDRGHMYRASLILEHYEKASIYENNISYTIADGSYKAPFLTDIE
jgi:hypothetical protein